MKQKQAVQKKRTQAGRSVENPGQPKSNPSGLPYGTGSIQIRGRVWWMIYRDTEGRTIQENTRTENQNEARRMLAVRALETTRAKVAALEQIVNEGQNQAEAGDITQRPKAHRRIKAAGGDRQGSGKGGTR
jgi:hypothetical protein